MVGISGGLDSTLALLVTVRAFDALGLHRGQIKAVTMPCFGTTDRTYNNACQLVRELGAELLEVNIREAVSLHFRDIGQNPETHDVTYENSQARERTQVLMDLANQCGGMVIGTGDMSELALGWATYNGDHMSMYGVNASVPKNSGAASGTVLCGYLFGGGSQRRSSGYSGYAGEPGTHSAEGRRDLPENGRSGRTVRTARFLLILYDAFRIRSGKDLSSGLYCF